MSDEPVPTEETEPTAPTDVPEDIADVPEYDDGDPEGDRQEFLTADDHKDHQELFPDEEPVG
jgi:hypothetical protein